jgi:hypothetical protein
MNAPATTAHIHGEATDDQVSVIQAVRDAAPSGARHATAVKSTINETGIIHLVSRYTYTGAYAISFGVVFAVMFVTQFLPPVMHGFSDGAQAAMDSLKGA